MSNTRVTSSSKESKLVPGFTPDNESSVAENLICVVNGWVKVVFNKRGTSKCHGGSGGKGALASHSMESCAML